jgi:hypothetical protein
MLLDGWSPGDMLEDGYFQNFKRDFLSGALVCDAAPQSRA